MKGKILLIILLCGSLLSANEMIMKTLGNGMQLVTKENRSGETVGLYCFVKTGSNNEGRFLGSGISHYLEHLVSGGSTTYRSEEDYQKLSQEMGALINAYTTNEITAFHIEVEKSYQDLALQVMSEQLFHCVLDSFEVAREKQVILKEIVMRSTSEMAKIGQRYGDLTFPESNKKYPVIGFTELFKTITREDLQEYYNERYAPNNMIFVAVGDFAASEMMTKLENTFSEIKRRRFSPVYLPIQNPRAGTVEFTEEFDIEQSIVFISYILPAEYYKDIPALNMALDILFEKRQSPINFKLKEELNLVNSLNAYADGALNEPEGLINISFEAKDAADIPKIIHIIDSEIEKFSKKGFKKSELDNVITRNKAQRLLSTPSVGRDANSIGWSLLRFGMPDYYETNIRIIEALTSKDLQDVLINHILPQNRVIFSAVPMGSSDLMTKTEKQTSVKSDITRQELKKNLTLLHRQTTEKPIIQGVVYLPLSTDNEPLELTGTFSFLLEVIFSGSKKYPPLELSEWLEDHVVNLRTNIGRRGTFIEFRCLKEDFSVLQEMLIDIFTNPIFAESEIKLAQDRYLANLQRSKSRASTAHDDFTNLSLFGDSKYGLSYEKQIENIMRLSRSDLITMYNKYFNASNAIITLTGDVSLDEAKAAAEAIFRKIPVQKQEREAIPMLVPDVETEFLNEYKFEQVNIDLNMPAPGMNDPDFMTFSVINLLFSGARGRIFKALRGENDLAYYGFSEYFYSQDNGYFRLTSQTSIDRKEELIKVLRNELEKLKTELVSREEIDTAIEENRKIMNSYMNDNRLPFYITRYEALGLGFDYIQKSAEYLKKVTSEDIQRAAEKYFKNVAVIVSQPSENVKLIVE
jgi:zinc protease